MYANGFFQQTWNCSYLGVSGYNLSPNCLSADDRRQKVKNYWNKNVTFLIFTEKNQFFICQTSGYYTVITPVYGTEG